jgi:hypothetical protein
LAAVVTLNPVSVIDADVPLIPDVVMVDPSSLAVTFTM